MDDVHSEKDDNRSVGSVASADREAGEAFMNREDLLSSEPMSTDTMIEALREMNSDQSKEDNQGKEGSALSRKKRKIEKTSDKPKEGETLLQESLPDQVKSFLACVWIFAFFILTLLSARFRTTKDCPARIKTRTMIHLEEKGAGIKT